MLRRLRDATLPVRAAGAVAFTLPLVLLTSIAPLGARLGSAAPWIELVLALPVVAWAALPFHHVALRSARRGTGSIDTLASLGITVAFGWSLVATLIDAASDRHYDTAAVITTLLLLGRWVESRLWRGATSAGASELDDISPTRPDPTPGASAGQRLTDRMSALIVPVVLAVAALTVLAWLLVGQPASALSAAVAVLVIASPRALGLAAPTALLTGSGHAAELGVHITGPETLTNAHRADVVVLDKSATLVTDTMRLVHIATAGRLTSTSALDAAAAAANGTAHPVAGAIVAAARDRGLALREVTNFAALDGGGARADIRDTTITIGRPDLFERVPEEIASPGSLGTTLYLGWGGIARAALTVADQTRPGSADAIARFRELGLTPYLLTGDNGATARAVADEVGIDPEHVLADIGPDGKPAAVAQLRGQGHTVALVGNAVADVDALAAADLGIATSAGIDVADGARERADIVLLRPELGCAADAVELSRRTLSIVTQNARWAVGYHLVAVPLAAFGLISPMIAGGATALAGVLLVVNSLRLRGFGRPG